MDYEHEPEREPEAAETLYSQLQGFTSSSQPAPTKLPEAAPFSGNQLFRCPRYWGTVCFQTAIEIQGDSDAALNHHMPVEHGRLYELNFLLLLMLKTKERKPEG